MRTRMICLAAAISGSFAFVGLGVAHADTTFSNFGPNNNPFSIFSSWAVSGPTSDLNFGIAVAMPFSSSVEADLTQIDAAFVRVSGTNVVGTATLNLFENAGGALGTQLGSWSLEDILNSPQRRSVFGISGVHLSAGGNYFLQATATGDAHLGWNFNSIGQTGTLLFDRTDTGPGQQNSTLGAFDIIGNVTAVPGPMIGTGLPGLILAGGAFLAWRRRKRKAQVAA